MNSIPIHSSENKENLFEIVRLKERNTYDSTKAHKHSYFEIFLFQKGGGTHDIDFKSYPILSQSIHFVFPNQVHKVTRDLDTFGFVILISKEYMDKINHELYSDLFSVYYLKPVVQLNAQKFNKSIGLLNNLTEEFANQDFNSEAVIKSYVSILLNFFLREKGEESRLNSPEAKNFRILIQFLILVETHFVEHNPVHFYSTKLSISERSLNEICRKFRNKTASVLIKERVILEIKKLLANSSSSIKEIVYSLNFNDPANFNKFFKGSTGVSPTQFRDEHYK